MSSGAIRAGKAFVEMGLDTAPLRAGLKALSSTLKSIGPSLGLAGGAIAGVGLAGLTGLVKLSGDLIERGKNLNEFRNRFGGTIEDASRLEVAAAAANVSLEDLQQGFENLPEKLVDAAMGSQEAATSFRQLGLDAQKLRTMAPIDILRQLAAGIEGVNKNDRSGVLGKLFGDDGARRMLAVVGNGVADLDNRLKLADRSGRLFTEGMFRDTSGKAAEWNRLKQAVIGVGEAVAGALLPGSAGLSTFTNQLVTAAESAAGFVRENRQLVLTVGAAAAGLVVVGGTLGAVGFALSGIGAGLATVGTVVATAAAAVTSPLGLVTTAVGGLGYLFGTQTELGGQLAGMLGGELATAFATFGGIAQTTWSGVSAALSSGDLAGAAEIATAGIEAGWAEMTANLMSLWTDFKTPLVDGWADITTAAASAWIDVQATIEGVLVDIGAIYDGYLAGWVESAGEQLAVVGEYWTDFAEGAGEVLAEFHIVAVDVFDGLLSAADSAFSTVSGWTDSLVGALGDIAAWLGLIDRQAIANAERMAARRKQDIEQLRQGGQGALADNAAAEKADREAARANDLAEANKAAREKADALAQKATDALAQKATDALARKVEFLANAPAAVWDALKATAKKPEDNRKLFGEAAKAVRGVYGGDIVRGTFGPSQIEPMDALKDIGRKQLGQQEKANETAGKLLAEMQTLNGKATPLVFGGDG